jgi:hypothetical protein
VIPVELSFADIYTLWRMVRFPANGSAEALRMIRADLVEATEYVTVVVGFVRTRVFRPSPADVLTLLGEIVDRVDGLSHEFSKSDLRVAREIRAYAVLLSLMYSAFLVAGRAGTTFAGSGDLG